MPGVTYACRADGDCPADQVCATGICQSPSGSAADGGSDDDAGAAADDAGAAADDAGTSSADAGPDDGDAGTAPDDAGAPEPDAGAPPECGNDLVEAGEQCDDGNVAERDGCSSACRRWWDESFPVRLRVGLRSPALAAVDAPVGLALPAGSFPATAPRDRACVVADDQRTVLPVEVERAATTTTDALLWTRLTLPIGDSEVFVYFGDAGVCAGTQAQVWPGYAGVFHFETNVDSAASVPLADAAGGPSVTLDGRRGAAVNVSSSGWPQVTPPGALWITGSVTLEIWGRLSALGSASNWENTLFQAAGDFASQAYFLNIENSGRLRGYWESSGFDQWSTAAVALATDDWHHYAMVRDNGARTVRFYVDGAQLGSVITFSGPPTDGPNPSSFIYFGGNTTASSRCFSGTLDEARIAPAALSADALAVSYAATAGTLVVSTTREPAL